MYKRHLKLFGLLKLTICIFLIQGLDTKKAFSRVEPNYLLSLLKYMGCTPLLKFKFLKKETTWLSLPVMAISLPWKL